MSEDRPLILFVERDEEFVELMVQLVKMCGGRAIYVTDPDEFVRSFTANKPSLSAVYLGGSESFQGTGISSLIRMIRREGFQGLVVCGTLTDSPEFFCRIGCDYGGIHKIEVLVWLMSKLELEKYKDNSLGGGKTTE
jgi:hypothetical protein